ncbi:MAG: carboxylesterase family protein [Sphingobacteriia bacterium]|jgi:lysophospholipase L1-like esterase
MKKGIAVLLMITCWYSKSFAQKRFKQEIFSQIDSVKNIQYGQAINLKGQKEDLLLDIISPQNDTMKKRPLLIFIHGGGFKNNSKTGAYSAMICNSFAKRGYVAATIDYRLGVDKNNANTDYAEALYRGQQDGKAAVRFFRKYADKYGIDTAQIFITGTSAGSKICLAMAYMDEQEIPKEIDQQKWGSLEGTSGNEGYSSKVQGVINQWGCVIDYKWINRGDAPLFNASGTSDKTVPYDSSFDYHGMKYGSLILYERFLSVGVPTGLRPFIGAGHTLDNNKIKQDSCIQSMATWLYTQLKLVKGSNEEGVFRWEKDIVQFDSLNKVEKHTKDALLFIGSSYIRLWENIRQDLDYKDIIHRGFGGCNFRDVAYYIQRIAYPHQPKAIFIYVGNDIVATEKDKSPDQVLELYKYIVKKLREKFPTIPISFLEISPSEKRWAAWDQIVQTNDLVKNYIASQPQLYFIASSDQFLGADGKPITKYYRDDKLHYNIEGYKVWGNHIKLKVKEIANK